MSVSMGVLSWAACTGGIRSIKLVFQDGKGHTLHEKDFVYEGRAAVIPGQGDLVVIPGGRK